jgi:hypothetical protein
VVKPTRKTATRARQPKPAPAEVRGQRGAGRPEYRATKRDRKTVALMIAASIDQAAIADVIEVSEPTLRKHFGPEIRSSYAKVKSRLANRLIGQAGRGNTKALIFYLETHGWMKSESLEVKGDLGFGKLLAVMEQRRKRPSG